MPQTNQQSRLSSVTTAELCCTGGDASISSLVESWKQFLGRNILIESKAIPGSYWKHQEGGQSEVDLSQDSQAFR